MTNWAQDNFAREASIKAAKPKPPPTQAQLERIDSMIDHPAFDHHMDSLTRRVDSMLKTRGGAGLLIGWMKNEIKKYDEEMAEAAAQAKAVAQAQFANLIAATGAPPPPTNCPHEIMVHMLDGEGDPIKQCRDCTYWTHNTSTKEDSK